MSLVMCAWWRVHAHISRLRMLIHTIWDSCDNRQIYSQQRANQATKLCVELYQAYSIQANVPAVTKVTHDQLSLQLLLAALELLDLSRFRPTWNDTTSRTPLKSGRHFDPRRSRSRKRAG